MVLLTIKKEMVIGKRQTGSRRRIFEVQHTPPSPEKKIMITLRLKMKIHTLT